MKKLLFVMLVILFAGEGWAQNSAQVVVGHGTLSRNRCNIPGWYGWHNSAMLFTSTELQSLRGSVQNLAFQIATPGDPSSRSMKIYLKQVPRTTTELSTASHMNDFLTGATLVYDSSNVAVTATGWRTFPFSTPFAISGDSNLLVIVTGQACGTDGGCEVSQNYTVAANKVWMALSSGGANIDFNTHPGTNSDANYRFNTRFTITPDPAQCFSVLNLTVSDQTPYTADLYWDMQVGNTASEWEIQYKLNSIDSWDNQEVITETVYDMPYTIESLLDEHTYDVRVRSLCNPGGTVEGVDISAWSPVLTFTQTTSCPPPAALAVPPATVSTDQATVTWTDEPSALEYLIQWKKTTLSWDDAGVLSSWVVTGEESFTLTQLQPGTPYNVRMRTMCDYNVDSSGWTSVSFTTQCGNISVDEQPWTESFEGLTTANTLPPCWSASNFGSSGNVRTQITDYNSSASFRHARTGHSALYFVRNCDDNVKTPSFALTAGITYRFAFWYHTDGLAGWQSLSASVLDEFNTVIDTIDTPLSNITNTNYLKYQGTFTPATSGIYSFLINCQATGTPWYLTIDDISLGIAPTCPDVDYFTATMHSLTAAALNWDLSSDAGNGWRIAYSNITPFDPETADYDTVASTAVFPYILDGLEDGTTYNFAIQSNCGGAWTAPVSISFPSLGNIKTLPYSQDFENSADVAEWLFFNNTTNGWYIGEATSNPADGHSLYVSDNDGLYNNYTPHSTTGYGYVGASVIVDFGNYQSYTLSFDWHCQGVGTYIEYVCFKVFAVPLTYNLTNAFPSGADVHQIGGTFWHQLDWGHFHAVLPANIYANQQYKIVFMFSYDNGTAVSPAPAIDNLVISGSDCSLITNVTASSITLNSAIINFNDSDPTQTSWEYVYGVAGTDPNNETPEVTSVKPFTLNGLTENTIYNIWIRTSCASSTAEWSPACTFLTLSSTGLIPYNCTFEANDPETTSWQQVTASGSNSWGVGTTYGNGSSQAGTQAAYITGNTGGVGVQNNYYYRVINFGATAANFDLSFDYISKGYQSGNNSTALYVWLVDENTPVTAAGLPVGNALSVFRTGDLNWHTYSTQQLNISGTKKLVFGYSKANMSVASNLNPAIDNISIEEITCPIPTEVTAVTSATNEQDVTLSWNANGGEDWIIYYKPVDATAWSSVPAATNPTTLQGLTLSTAYHIYIVTDCSSGTLSDSSSAILYYTPCVSTGLPLPYTQNFEAYPGTEYNTIGVLPSCWASTGTYAIKPHITGSGSYHYPHSPPNALTFSTTGGVHSYAVLPKFTTPVENLILSFWYQQYSADRGILQVGYITGDDQTDMSTYTTIVDVPPSGIFAQFTYDFPTSDIDLSEATHIVLHWSHTHSTHYEISVDDISVDVSNTCPAPKSINISPITQTGATVSWTSSASQWKVAWKITEDDNWNYADATSNSYHIPGLTAATNYDLKVRTFCTSDSSVWSPVVQFTTGAVPVCATPVILNTTPLSPTSATITWTINTATKWIVEYKTASATEWTWTGDTVEVNSITLNNLTTGTTYQARVKAICDIDFESEWSTETTFTLQAPCNAPTILNTTSTNNTITMTWQANSNETAWTVTWKTEEESGQANVSGTPAHTFSSLLPGTSYHICVKALCDGGAVSDSVCTDVSTTTAIHDIALANGLKLYPNPTGGELRIMNYELREGDKIEVYNMLGQEQPFSILDIQQATIDVSRLSAGMYVVKIGGAVGKFVKR